MRVGFALLFVLALARPSYAQRPACQSFKLETTLAPTYLSQWETAILRTEGRTISRDASADVTAYVDVKEDRSSREDSFGSNVVSVVATATVRLVGRDGFSVTRTGSVQTAFAQALRDLEAHIGSVT